jgi:integrase
MSKLTQQFVKSVTQPGTYQDGRGLMLNVKPSGRKYWVLRYQINGARRDMGLGVFPSISLKDARSAADRNRLVLNQGIDPLDHKAVQLTQAKRSRRDTFKAEALRYIKSQSPAWSARHTQQWERSLELHVFPRLGNVPVGDISTDDIVETLMLIWHTKQVTAERVRNRIELVLDASRARELRSGENPARWRGHLDKLLPRRTHTVRPMESMPYQLIPDFMRQLDAVDGTAARCLELIILTALRTNEATHARWEEFDFEERIWTVPGLRMKNGKAHRVPLNDSMIEVLNQQRGKHEDLVFPSNKVRNVPIGLNAADRVLRSLGVKQYVVHGFRSTFRTWAGEETHHPREVCELCLAHTIAQKTEAAYSRGDKLGKRRILMEEWALWASALLAQAA